jgi:hypothetical protein
MCICWSFNTYFTEIYNVMQYVQVRNILFNPVTYYIFYGTNFYQDLVPIYYKNLQRLALIFIKI